MSQRLPVVLLVAVGRDQQRAVDEVEVDVGGGEALAVVLDDAGHGDFDDVETAGRPGPRSVRAAFEVVLEDLVVVVLRVIFDGGDDRVGVDEAGEVVDVAVGVVAGDSFAEPDRRASGRNSP